MTISTADRSLHFGLDVPARSAVRPVGTESRPPFEHGSPATVEPLDSTASSPMDRLSRAQYDAVAATVTRRRSLTDSLQIAFAAYWDTVVAQREAHLAVRSCPPVPPAAGRSGVHPGAPEAVSCWLTLIIDAHQMRWELPDQQIALLVSATLEGLTVDFLGSGKPDPARPVLQVLAYQIGRFGRRPTKNQQH